MKRDPLSEVVEAHETLVRRRAGHLTEFIEQSCTKLRADSLEEAQVDLNADPPVMPYRYCANEWDGSETWVAFYDSVEDAQAGCEQLGGEVPHLADTVLDLDTGNTYEVRFTVTLAPMRVKVRYRVANPDGEAREYDMQATTKAEAREFLAKLRPHLKTEIVSVTNIWKEDA